MVSTPCRIDETVNIASGQRIANYLKSLLVHLLDQDFATKTLHLRRDNLWALGDEDIGRRQDKRLRHLAVEKPVCALIWPQISEQQSFNATS